MITKTIRKNTKRTATKYKKSDDNIAVDMYELVKKATIIRVKFYAPKFEGFVDTTYTKNPLNYGWVVGQTGKPLKSAYHITEDKVMESLIKDKYDAEDGKIKDVYFSFSKSPAGRPFKIIRY